ncbi:hypothetical protein C9374_013867 [Naegleria lovaniensis]|uniref:non-specific serine/threonine protein kinase n=1 Tax=Naegleria lovaniensis TaxID=51637 RepID=A0AA88KUN5_NAELO|nr:uncharacterized protein C9374_013867 [Naegleria lovaniensis]KAG2389307.1 hypothetical protein C9374_013867 [Naegleria lovaniensis]
MSQHHSSSYSSSSRGRGYKHTSSTSFSNPNAPTPTREYYGSGGGSSVSSSHHQQARHRDDDYDRYSRSYQGNDASSYRQGRPPSSPSSYYHDERKRAEPSYQHYKDPVHDDRSNVSNTNVSSHHNYHSENYNYRKFYDHNRPSHGYRDDKISRKEDHYQNRPTSHPASGNYSQQSSSNYQQRHDDRYHPPSKSPSRNIPASSHVTPLTNNETRTKNQQTETKRKSVVAFKDQHDERTITPDMKRVKSEKSSIMEPSEKLSATNKGTFNNVSNIVTQQQIAPPPNEEEIIKQTLIMEEQLIKANDENEVKRKREERKKKFQQMEKEKQEASPHPQSEDSIASDDENQAFVAPLSSDAFKSGGNSFYYELEQERNKLQERSAIDDEINESSKEPAAVSLHDDTTNVKENEGESSPFIDMFGASTDELVQALAEPSAHVNTAVDLYDDPEGYYRFTIGEVMNDRYKIEAFLGQGVFSSVVQASDKLAKDPQSQRVAIKIIRSSETMRKAGTKELNIISMLMEKDPNDESHIIRMLDHFTYRNHLCLVFELLEMNLRDVLKHYGRREGKQVGISMDAVRVYTKQLLVALKHIQDCNILHADIKPDNMLVHPSHTKIKLSDLGSASDVSENSITPYLVSRFYRAPEIILGMKYSYPIDMWSVACTVFELYTGKILFPSQNNNDAIRLMMELKGKFSNKVLKKCAFRETHFDFNGDGAFLFREWDPLTKKIKTRKLYYQKSVTDLKAMLLNSMISNQHLQDEKAMKEERKLVLMLHDFLDKALILDPSKRLTVSDALKHPFVTETTTTIHTENLVNV